MGVKVGSGNDSSNLYSKTEVVEDFHQKFSKFNVEIRVG